MSGCMAEACLMGTLRLQLHRVQRGKKATLGALFVDGEFECCTLEDVVREVKIPHETAIPAGMYEVVLTHSPKYGRIMPRLLGVPGFDGILIHSGNTDADTWGCILVGGSFDEETITRGTSRPAFAALFGKLQGAVSRGDRIYITVTNDYEVGDAGGPR